MMAITILQNVSLKLHSTMRLGGIASFCCEIFSEQDLLQAVAFADTKNIPLRVIGIGSNIVWRDEGFEGLLVVNKINDFEQLQDELSLRFGAGYIWDDAVEKSVDLGLSGLEFLSLIPGTVGATPVQNVGAYGAEVKDTITTLRAYDLQQKEYVDLAATDCAFTYRSSRFKTVDSGRFIITSVTFLLSKTAPAAPFYDALQKYLDDNSIIKYSPQNIRSAVIAIRRAKLPDPASIANNGSFFANPIVTAAYFELLKKENPDLKCWQLPDGNVKIAAGWLIEQAGFKDFHDQQTGMATWHAQSLVLINEQATSTQQLIDFKQKIVDAVNDKFSVTLDQEPELLP